MRSALITRSVDRTLGTLASSTLPSWFTNWCARRFYFHIKAMARELVDDLFREPDEEMRADLLMSLGEDLAVMADIYPQAFGKPYAK